MRRLDLRSPSVMSQHRVQRPEWTCRIDGENWPCPPARRQLRDIHKEDPDVLSRLLATLSMVAAVDLGTPSPALLYRRFVAWTLGSATRCRVCQRRGHDVLPGLPPRVFPCPKLAECDAQGQVTTGT
ncbi:hypothetical protein Voc01_048730 [Virgisporangium ochraceum]|uniref:Uncharacterized protein n=1 Tax=Virgisporangium ochraceum TaxID=65505 RepID=A0A8J4ECQ9_9ACTN|nr:hypothetical protein Voc01_048730 [Virgisporangium ochraceum]